MKYVIKVFVNDYVKVGEEYQNVEAETRFTFHCWDDVQNFIGYMVDGKEGRPIKFEITTKEEDK